MSSLDYLLPTSTPGGEDWEWATVTSVAPLRIRIDGDSAPLAGSPDSLVAPANLHVNKRVWVRFQSGSKSFGQVGGRYVIIGPSDLESDAVRYTVSNRRIEIGPDGDYDPILEFQRSRPGYSARAMQYVAANPSTTELAWALGDNGTTHTTMRLTRNGLSLQDNAGGSGSKMFTQQSQATWTPVLTGSSTNPTVTAAEGRELRLGPLVIATGYVTISAIGGGTYILSGFPTAQRAWQWLYGTGQQVGAGSQVGFSLGGVGARGAGFYGPSGRIGSSNTAGGATFFFSAFYEA